MAVSPKGSDESFDNICSPCSETGNKQEGKTFCEECELYFCDQCLREHNKFPALRSHKTVDKTQGQSTGNERTTLTERCSLHRGQVINQFCIDHDEVCCEICVTIRHRYCVYVDNITEAAKGIKTSSEYRDVKQAFEDLETKIKEEQDKRDSNVSSLDEKSKHILDDIDKMRDDIIERIKEISDASRKEVISKKAELVKAARADDKELETVLAVSRESSEKLSTAERSDAQLFVNLKQSKQVLGDVDKIVTELRGNWTTKEIEYNLDTEIAYCVASLTTFGHFGKRSSCNKPRVEAYAATPDGKFNIKTDSDVNVCDVTGVCPLADGSYIVSDFANKSLKKLSTDFHVLDSVQLDGSPISLCTIGKQKVATALRKRKKIQFVSCGTSMLLKGTLKTDLICTGLFFDSKSNELYVCCGAHWLGDQTSKINVYITDGTLLRSIETDETGSRLFSSPNNIVLAPNGLLYVADSDKGLVSVTKTGKKLWTYRAAKLIRAWGVCFLPGNQILVTGLDSGNILQVRADGTEVCELIGPKDELRNTYSVTCDQQNSRIIVGQPNEIRVYEIRQFPTSP